MKLWYVIIFLSYVSLNSEELLAEDNFEVVYSWSHINFTWHSWYEYNSAVSEKRYIPENVMPGGIKLYDNFVYVSVPRLRQGIPVTIARLSQEYLYQKNVLLEPYPNWEFNDDTNCSNLQSILGLEIDANGVLWLLDGVRLRNNIQCPTKLVLLDLNNQGKILKSHVFPNEISFQNGGFLNDIVVDNTDNGFAYITDPSSIDPGLIVYSLYEDKAWKLRDTTMFHEPRGMNLIITDYVDLTMTAIDGIALSPNLPEGRTVYYTPLAGYAVHGINTSILKSEQLCRSSRWRNNVTYVGDRQGQTDGMMMDSRGHLFYTLLPQYGVGRWNMFESFDNAKIIDTNRSTMVWTDGFGMDQKGYLYLITNWAFRYYDSSTQLNLTSDVKFRILRLYTGTRSYLYNDLSDLDLYD